MATPGTIDRYGAMSMYPKENWSIEPQVGVGGLTPTPRKLRPAQPEATNNWPN